MRICVAVAEHLIVIKVKVTNDDSKYSKLELNKVMDENHTELTKNTFKNRKSLFWRQPYSFDFTFFATKIGGDETRLGYVRYVQGIQPNVPAHTTCRHGLYVTPLSISPIRIR